MIEVELKEHNAVIEFPDETSEDEMLRAIQAQFGVPEPAVEEPGFLEKLRGLPRSSREPRKPVDLEAAKQRVMGLARGVKEFFDVMAPYREQEPEYLEETPIRERFARGFISTAAPGTETLYEARTGKPYLPPPETPAEEISQALGSAGGFVAGLPGLGVKMTVRGLMKAAPWLKTAAEGGLAKRTLARIATEVPGLGIGTGIAEADHLIQNGADRAYLEILRSGAIMGGAFGLAGGAFPKDRLYRILTGLVALEGSRAASEGIQGVLDAPLYQRAYQTALDVLFLWGHRPGGEKRITELEKAVNEGRLDSVRLMLRDAKEGVKRIFLEPEEPGFQYESKTGFKVGAGEGVPELPAEPALERPAEERLPLVEPEPIVPEKGKPIVLTDQQRQYWVEKNLQDKQPTAKGEPQEIVLTGGPPGAGKSTSTKALGIDKSKFVIADPDLIKEQAGYKNFAKEFHEESSLINKMLTDRTLEERYNLIYDSLMSNFPLADAIIQKGLRRRAKIGIAFTNIDAETSQMRSELRYEKHKLGMSAEEGASPRRIPAEVSAKGHNQSLPTFIALWKRYRNTPEIDWVLVDNGVDGRPPVVVFEQKAGKLTVHDQARFDKLMNTPYITKGSGEELRYERRDKITEADLLGEEAQERIRDRVVREIRRSTAAPEPGTVPTPKEAPRKEVVPPGEAQPRAPPAKAVQPKAKPSIPAKKPKAIPDKELWEFTREEWIENSRAFWADRINPPHESTFGAAHYKAVEKAVSEGKPVPAEVLKDYPELKPAPSKAEQARAEFEAKKAEPKKAPAKGPTKPGVTTTVEHSEGRDPASYQLMEASDVLPSHDMLRGFARNEAYPEKVQERPYHTDKAHQAIVISRSTPGKFEPRYLISDNPDAINGPPIVTPEGVVLGGNSRAMLIQYVYGREAKSAEKYRKLLKEQAEKFGIKPEDVDAMKEPMLVRALAESPKDMARKARLYNQPLTQALEAKAEGVSRARMVSQESMERLAGDLEDFGTLREYLSSTRSKDLIQDLVRDGALEQTQLNRLTHPKTGLLTEDGKLLVERTLRGKIIDDLDLLESVRPAILNKLDRALPALTRVRARGAEWDLTEQLKKALTEHAKMKAAGMTYKEFMETQELFGDQAKREAQVTDLIRVLEEMKPTEFKQQMEAYAQAAERDVAKQEVLGFFDVEKPAEAFTRLFVDRGTEGKEIQAFEEQIDGLFEPRKPPPPSIGLSTRAVGRPIEKPAKVPETPPGVERARGIPEDHQSWIRRKAREALEWMRTAPRTYRSLPRKATKEVLGEDREISFARAAETLRHNRADYEVAQTKAVRYVRELTRDLPSELVSTYYDAVVAADLAYESGRRSIDQLPFDMTREEALEWKQQLDQAVSESPELQKAIQNRKKLYKLVADKLVDVGILKEDQIYEVDEAGERVRMKNEDYFHHQVLQYAQVQRRLSGKKITKPKPGYAKKRSLKSTLDYNTDVFQADLLHLTRALYDIRRALRFKGLLTEYDIASELRKSAKKQGIKKWEELIPKGYEKQQWDPGRTFFQAETLPERILREIWEEGMAEVVPEDLRKIVALGRPKKEYVIPSELADTFRQMTKPYDLRPVKKIARGVTGVWKRSVLFLPRRWFRYNYQNFLGDLDAVIAGAPKIATNYALPAAKKLYRFYHGEQVPETVMDSFERGCLTSTLTFEEIPRASELHVFDNIPEAGKKPGLISRYFRQAIRMSTFRENVFRLAAYEYYLDQYKGGRVPEVGASIREDVEALSDPKDRAAKVSRELVGDYGAISEIGRELRQGPMPFWSWNEVNLGRYKRLIQNSFSEAKLQGTQPFMRLSAVFGGKLARKIVSAWAKILFLTSSMHLYNQLTHSDYEATLSDYDRRRVHLNITRWYHLLGGDPNKTMILRGQSAVGDLFEWGGFNDVIASLDDYRRGIYSGKDLALQITKAPVNKLVQSINPFVKIFVEAVSGASYFPDFTKPRYARGTITQRFVQSLANAFTLGDEWRLLTHMVPGLEPLPMRNYAKGWQDAIVIARDVDEQAYAYILDRKYRYLERMGKGGRHLSSAPLSLAYYNYKLALRLKDQEASSYWKQKIITLKGSQKDADKGIKASLDYTRPMAGLRKSGTDPGSEFHFQYKYLSAKERQLMRRAENFHRQIFGR